MIEWIHAHMFTVFVAILAIATIYNMIGNAPSTKKIVPRLMSTIKEWATYFILTLLLGFCSTIPSLLGIVTVILVASSIIIFMVEFKKKRVMQK